MEAAIRRPSWIAKPLACAPQETPAAAPVDIYELGLIYKVEIDEHGATRGVREFPVRVKCATGPA